MLLVTALQGHRKADFCDFKEIMVYSEFQASQLHDETVPQTTNKKEAHVWTRYTHSTCHTRMWAWI